MLHFGLPPKEQEEQPPPPSRFTQQVLLLFQATHYDDGQRWQPYTAFNPMELTERMWRALQLLRDALASFRGGNIPVGADVDGYGDGDLDDMDDMEGVDE